MPEFSGMANNVEEGETQEKERFGARVSATLTYTRTQPRNTAKREQKATGCSRAVGQMFKQTSNYLNSIWDLRGVPALESIALLLSPLSLSLRSFRVHSCSVCLFSPFVFEAPAEDVVGRVPRKKHKTCISFATRAESWFPFMSRRFRPATLSGSLSLSLFLFLFLPFRPPLSLRLSLSSSILYSFFDHRHYATTGCVHDALF